MPEYKFEDRLKTKATQIRTLQTFYRRFETDETVHRLEVLRNLAGQLRRKAKKATFLVGGSLAFGMAETNSDFDLIYAGDPRWYSGGLKGHFGFAKLHPILVTELSKLMGREVEICEQWMNRECWTPLIRSTIADWRIWRRANFDFESLNQVFMFYQLYNINRPIDSSLDHLAERIEAWRADNSWIDRNLKRDEYVWTFGYGNSFRKYHMRLARRGIEVPAEILGLEAQFTDEDEVDHYVESEQRRVQMILLRPTQLQSQSSFS